MPGLAAERRRRRAARSPAPGPAPARTARRPGAEAVRHLGGDPDRQLVRPSSAPPGRTAIALPSIGITASRWLTIRARTTTSASASGSASADAQRRPRGWCPAPGTAARRVRLERGLHVDDGGQRVVVDLDQLGGVDGGGLRLGDHDRDRLPDEPDPVGGQRRARQLRVDDHQAVVGRQVEVGRGEHGDDARRRRRGPAVSIPVITACASGERTNARCRTPVEGEVADVGAGAGDEVEVLDAADGGPENRSRHVDDTTVQR